MPMIGSNGVEKAFLPETGNPSPNGQFCFPPWGAALTFGNKAWSLGRSPLCKKLLWPCSEAEDLREAAVPVKSFRDSYPMTPVLVRVTTLQQGTSGSALSPFV